MKGVILAAGKGTRLDPLTKIINKQMLPIYDRPMIDYPIQKLKEAGINDIAIVINKGDYKLIHSYLGDNYTYITQNMKEQGIAKAILTAEQFVGDSKFIVHLGDQIYESSIKDFVRNFNKSNQGCRLLLKETGNQARYHTVAYTKGNELTDLIEKPDVDNGLTMVGIYAFTPKIFDYLKSVGKSERGEYEICDAIKDMLIKEKNVGYDILEGAWVDAGTFDNLYLAAGLIKNWNKGIK